MRRWKLPGGAKKGFEPLSLFLDRGHAYRLEVAVARTERRPSIVDVRNLWNKRHANRPSTSATIDIVVKPTVAGVITNTASVAASAGDLDRSDNTASVDTNVCRITSRRSSIPCG